MKRAALFSSLLLCIFSNPASAADLSKDGSQLTTTGILSELRLGIMSHDVARREKGSVDLQAELLFNAFGDLAPDASVLQRFLTPRPHLGASLSTDNETSYGYAGLTWHFPVFDPVFVEGSLGAAIHNGKINNTSHNREPLGTRALFRETASLGVQLDDRASLMLSVEHMSNAGIGKWNHGLTSVGAHIGYMF